MLSRVLVFLGRAARRFRASNHGNVAMMFAVVSIPLIVAVGGVIDYSRASVVRTQMQDALDATSLALSRQTNIATMSAADMLTYAQNYFNANFTDKDIDSSGITLVPSYVSTGPSVTVTASGKVPMDFLGLIGLSKLPINTTSTTIWGQSRLRVALVLDNTKSMEDDGKMAALKTATTSLLAQLKAVASTDGDVYVSIIPFVKDVNAGASNYAQTWVRFDDGTDNSWDGQNGTCSKSGYSPRSSCVAQGTCSKSGSNTQSACVATGTCSSSSYTTQSSCTSHGKKWTAATWTPATWTHANHNTWTGCVTDRDQNYDTTNTAPSTGTTGTLFPADWNSSYDINTSSDLCPQAVMGLNYNWTSMNTLVSNMTPNGNTNQAIGLQWGYQSLTSAPFTIPAQDPKYTYKQIIILLTDGLNTEDRWYSKASSIDARESLTCDNIRAANISLYAVQVDTGGDPTSTLLQNCAPSGQFFLLTSASQIVTTFNSIGTALSNLRLKG